MPNLFIYYLLTAPQPQGVFQELLTTVTLESESFPLLKQGVLSIGQELLGNGEEKGGSNEEPKLIRTPAFPDLPPYLPVEVNWIEEEAVGEDVDLVVR